MKKYQITVDDDQAKVIVRALDMFARIGVGQFEDIPLFCGRKEDIDYESVRQLLQAARDELMGPNPVGIHHKSVPESCRVAWDIEQVVRHRLAWDKNPEGGIGVHFDEPCKLSTLPLCEIREVK